MAYYSVKVKVETMDERGKVKKQSELYLIEALSVTEAEAKMVKDFEEFPSIIYEVSSVSETRFLKIIE